MSAGEIEAPVCRVCHGESEPGRELFFPCKCDGSIKYVHQDCLQEWLKHARNKSKCELCGEEFKFKKIYKEGMSLHLSFLEVFQELLPRLGKIITTVFHIIFSGICWVIILPIFVSYWMKLNWCFVSDLEPETCHITVWKFIPTIQFIISIWYVGIVDLCLIGVITFFAVEMYRMFYKNIKALKKNCKIMQLDLEVIERKRRSAELELSLHTVILELVEVLINIIKLERAGLRLANLSDSEMESHVSYWDRIEESTLRHFADWRIERHEIQESAINQFTVDRQRLHIAGEGTVYPVLQRDLNFISLVLQWLESSWKLRVAKTLNASFHPVLKEYRETMVLYSFWFNRSSMNLRVSYLDTFTEKYEKIKHLNQLLNITNLKVHFVHMLETVQNADIHSTETTNVIEEACIDTDRPEDDTVLEKNHSLIPTEYEDDNRITSVRQTEEGGPVEDVEHCVHDAAEEKENFAQHSTSVMVLESEQLSENQVVIDDAAINEVSFEAQQGKPHENIDSYSTAIENSDKSEQHAVKENTENPALNSILLEEDDRLCSFEENKGIDAIICHSSVIYREDKEAKSENDTVDHGEDSSGEDQVEEEEEEVEEEEDEESSEVGIADLFPLFEDFFPAPLVGGVVELNAQIPLDHHQREPLILPMNQAPENRIPLFHDDPLQQQNNNNIDNVAVGPLLHEEPQNHNQNPIVDNNNERDNNDNNVIVGIAIAGNNGDVLAINLDYWHFLVFILYIAAFGFVALLIPAAVGKIATLLVFDVQPLMSKLQETATQVILEDDSHFQLVLELWSSSSIGLGSRGEDIISLAEGGNLNAAEAALVAEAVVHRLRAIVELLLGYGVCIAIGAAAGLLYMAQYFTVIQRLFQPRMHGNPPSFIEIIWQETKSVIDKTCVSTAKTAVTVILYFIVLPGVFAIVLWSCLRRTLEFYLSYKETDAYAPLAALFLLSYILSFLVIAHISIILSELRPLITPFAQALPTMTLPLLEIAREPTADQMVQRAQQIMPNRSFVNIVQAFIVECGLLLPALLCCVVIPLRAGHFMVGTAEPLRLRMESVMVDLQVPGGLMISHILLPVILEVLMYRQVVQTLIRWQVEYTARLTGCEPLLVLQYFPHLQPVEEDVVGVVAEAPQPIVNQQGRPAEVPPAGDVEAVNAMAEPQPQAAVEANTEHYSNVHGEYLGLDQQNQTTDTAAGRAINEEEDDEGVVDTEEIAAVMQDMLEAVTADTSKSWLNDPCAASIDGDVEGVADNTAAALEDAHAPDEPHVDDAANANPAEPVVVVDADAAADIGPTLPREATGGLRAATGAPAAVSANVFAVFVCLQVLCFTLLSCWVVHVPVVVGRWVLGPHSPLHSRNDMLNIPAGFILCWAMGQVLKYVLRDVFRSQNTRHLVNVGWKWIKVISQVAVGGFLWMIVFPILIGYALEALFILPFRVYLDQTPYYPWIQVWALGLVLLKIFAKGVLGGVFGDIPLRLELEMLLIRGFEHFDLPLFLQRIYLPMVLPICDVVLVSHCLGRLAGGVLPHWIQQLQLALRHHRHRPVAVVGGVVGGDSGYYSSLVLAGIELLAKTVVPVTRPWLSSLLSSSSSSSINTNTTSVYLLRTLMARFSMHLYLLCRLVVFSIHHGVKYAVRVYNEVRDQRYLIGTELTNRVRAT